MIHLPIADISLDGTLLLALGAAVGCISAIFGIGGGFLLTPILILLGVPSTIAVAASVHQIVASSVSSVLAHRRRGQVDERMGGVLLVGGFFGVGIGIILFRLLQNSGQADFVISLAYMVLLGIIGLLMIVESTLAWLRPSSRPYRRKIHHHSWLHKLPWRMRFRRSRLYVSIIPPLFIGFFVGIMTTTMGVGGGFVLVPAMIYLLGMPTSIAIATSLLHVLVVSAASVFLQATVNHSLDIVLAFLLIMGGVVGAQIGVVLGGHMKATQLRGFLGLIVFAVCLLIGHELMTEPDDLYVLQPFPT